MGDVLGSVPVPKHGSHPHGERKPASEGVEAGLRRHRSTPCVVLFCFRFFEAAPVTGSGCRSRQAPSPGGVGEGVLSDAIM